MGVITTEQKIADFSLLIKRYRCINPVGVVLVESLAYVFTGAQYHCNLKRRSVLRIINNVILCLPTDPAIDRE
ncbi:Uncharacterised protein [Vibrio cholerae]|nr:Uncharacterised protein [Vibrio cholerae]